MLLPLREARRRVDEEITETLLSTPFGTPFKFHLGSLSRCHVGRLFQTSFGSLLRYNLRCLNGIWDAYFDVMWDAHFRRLLECLPGRYFQRHSERRIFLGGASPRRPSALPPRVPLPLRHARRRVYEAIT